MDRCLGNDIFFRARARARKFQGVFMGPIGLAQISTILKEFKRGKEEDYQIHKEQENSYFDKKIAELKNQAQTLREKARQISAQGFFNFFSGLFTAALDGFGGVLSGMKIAGKITEKAFNLFQTSMTALKEMTNATQSMINGFFEKSKTELDAKEREQQQMAEIFSKLASDEQNERQKAQKQASETLQTLHEIKREMVASQETMIKI